MWLEVYTSNDLSELRCGDIECFGLHWRILSANLLWVKLRLWRSNGLPPVGCRITTGPLVDVWCDLLGSLQPTRVMDTRIVLTVLLAPLFVSHVYVCIISLTILLLSCLLSAPWKAITFEPAHTVTVQFYSILWTAIGTDRSLPTLVIGYISKLGSEGALISSERSGGRVLTCHTRAWSGE